VSTSTETLSIADLLRSVGACPEALRWAEGYDNPQAAWNACPRGDWMLWLLGRLSGPPDSDSRKAVVVCACECARLALPQYEVRHPDDRRPRNAIETAERHCKGRATLKEVTAAADAAYAYAAYAADARKAHWALMAEKFVELLKSS
jgi:hypothetical protein